MNPLILTKNNLYYLQLIIAIPKRITTILIVTVTTIVAAKENNSFMISLTLKSQITTINRKYKNKSLKRSII